MELHHFQLLGAFMVVVLVLGLLFVCFLVCFIVKPALLSASGNWPALSESFTFGLLYICFPCDYSVLPVYIYLTPGVMFSSPEKCDFWYLYFKSKVCLGLK